MQGLTEAANYQMYKILTRKVRLTIKPIVTLFAEDIKRVSQRTGSSQVAFACSLGVYPIIVEAYGRNKQNGAPCRLLEIVKDDPGFFRRFQA